jgi:hypothetical protein
MPRNLARQQLSLIETPTPAPIPMQRHGDDNVVSVVDRQSAIEKPRQVARQRTHARILKQMDQAAQRAIVKTKARRPVEAEQARTAQSTDAVGIERKTVLKRSVAVGAEVIRFERRRRVQAFVANRNAGKSVQRGFADAAGIRENDRENKRKNSVGDPTKGGSGRSR